MATKILLSLQLLSLLTFTLSAPLPGRVPKVYNALITSNQHLEPSKAYPVYQPVIQESVFGFPFQPTLFYGGDYPTLYASAPVEPKAAPLPETPEAPKDDAPSESKTESSTPSDADTLPSSSPSSAENKGTPVPPPPPSTQSPIPLNQFGLPPAVIPLGRFDPSQNGFNQVSSFYTYPDFRFYDPYDTFNLNPYLSPSPVLRGIPNFSGIGSPLLPQGGSPLLPQGGSPLLPQGGPPLVPQGGSPLVPQVGVPRIPVPDPSESNQGSPSSPPPEPNNLNILNYIAKDEAIPNVPPPPLPQGGLKSDKSE